MYVIYEGKKYWISRAYWFNSGDYTIYEFVSVDGDVYSVEVKPSESLNDLERLYFEQEEQK